MKSKICLILENFIQIVTTSNLIGVNDVILQRVKEGNVVIGLLKFDFTFLLKHFAEILFYTKT